MKYDNKRAITLASVFGVPRYPGTIGETAALDRFAVELADAGWNVSQDSAMGVAPRLLLAKSLYSGIIAVLLALAVYGLTRATWAKYLLMTLAVRFLVSLFVPRYSTFMWPRIRSVRVVEGTAGSHTPLPHVVIFTRVATLGAGLSVWDDRRSWPWWSSWRS